MKSTLRLFGIAGAILLTVATAQTQPANDFFADRIPLTGPSVSTTGSNVDATTEGGEPLGGGFFRRGATVWWQWTAPANGQVYMDTLGSSFDTILGVYTGASVGALTEIALNDNIAEGNSASLVAFTAQQGVAYQIQVAGAPVFAWPPVPPQSGMIQLHIGMPPAVSITSPANNTVFGATTNFLITAQASAVYGTVEKVDFFSYGKLLGTAWEAPYTLAVSNANLGSNSLYAVVMDTGSQRATSAVVNVLVARPGLTTISPPDGTTFSIGNSINFAVYALLPSGTSITNVEFFANAQLIGSDRFGPLKIFNMLWYPPTGGSFRLMATGRDNSGNVHQANPISVGVASPLVARGAEWKYLDDGSDQGTAWIAPDYNDESWASGPAELGYGDGDEATVVSFGPNPNNRYITTYFRRAFTVADAASLSNLVLNVKRDDGAVVYLNGVEVARFNMPPGPINYTTLAPNASDDGANFYPANLPASLLVDGVNLLAVELHQSSVNNNDLSFDLELIGYPIIIGNRRPAITLTSPIDGEYFTAPASIALNAEASDLDGTVTRVEFFRNNTKLTEFTSGPYTLTLDDVPAGTHTFTAVATDDLGSTNTSAPVTVIVYNLSTRWVAYNDHYAGPNTHPYATAWNAFGTADGAPGDEGPLRNIATGATLPATLTVLELGAGGDTEGGAPLPGTPAYETFHDQIDFGSGNVLHSILVDGNAMVLHLFTGLNPNRTYHVRATAVGGVPAHSNRWTQFTITGAAAFTAAHTGNVLTSADQPGALYPDEAAMNTGDNLSGDMVGWDDVVPGPDGAFVVISAQYLGPAPGNEVPGPFALAPVAVRLEEIGAQPLVEILEPLDGTSVQGPTNIVITAAANALDGITNVLFLANGSLLGQATESPYSLEWYDVPFGTHSLAAVAIDGEGLSSTSALVSVTITIPPTNTIPPAIQMQNPLAGATITQLTTVEVAFTEWVVGVNASDLLVNGLPATEVSGLGTNYLFTVPQPAYGTVQISWAPNHGITDVGWPSRLAFDETQPDASWTYDLRDRTPPTIAGQNPPAGAALTNLTRVTVVFSEAVTGVNAGDLRVNGIPAYAVNGFGGTYNFNISQPPSGPVQISWDPAHGIADQSDLPNPFDAAGPGATWDYTLNTRTILVASNSNWALLKGYAEASIPVEAWRELDFEDWSWTPSPAPFFFGDPYSNGLPAYTLLNDMQDEYTSIYLRQEFIVPNIDVITNLILRAQSDDGFIGWINGVEVVRYNMAPGQVAYNETASASAPEPSNRGAAYINHTIPDPRSYLRVGRNVLAVHAFNQSPSSDFGFNAELHTYQVNTEVVAPRIVGQDPPPGYALSLTEVTVTFSEPVANVDAADLLINGVPATGLSSETNTLFTFSFPQPSYGPVSVTWAGDHGIVDLDRSPKPFDSLAPESTWEYTLLNPSAPHLITVAPAPGSGLTQLTQVTITFSELVTGVDAADLLVNGTPATGLAGSGTNYTFSFPNPPYGLVSFLWATNHGIRDLDDPPVAFDPSWPGHTWTYNLLDQTPPAVASQNPVAGSQVMNLTQITVVFTEPVAGVNASDLLINGLPSASVTGTNTTYTFTFQQPNATSVQVTWAGYHGITDLASPPNPFVATAPGATWSYTTVDNVPPRLVGVTPEPYETVRSIRKITLLFDEPVQGLNTDSLTVALESALTLGGSGAGPYVFEFAQPETGQVAVALSGSFTDLATVPNQYLGSNWTYVLNTNLPPPSITRGPYLQVQTDNSIIVRWRTSEDTDSRLEYGLDAGSRTNVLSGGEYTTEHIITITNLNPDTRYEYAIGDSDDLLVVNTNFHFVTAPPVGISRPTRVWFLSDYGTSDANERAVRDLALGFAATNGHPDVWITGGDNDQNSGQDTGYSTSVFGTQYGYGEMLQHQVFWPTIGNHDYATGQGQNYYANFSMPMQGEAGGVPSGSQHYYSFDYADIHFICLDSIDGAYSRTTNSAMIQWLGQDLANTTQRWIIAYWHGPPYSKGTHDSDSTTDTLSWMVQMRENVVPLLEAYGVDLVICGHSHVFERSWLLNGHYGYSSTFSQTHKLDAGDGWADGPYLKPAGQKAGAVYVVAALGGRPQNGSGSRHPAHLRRMDQLLGTCYIDVNSNRLDFQFIGALSEPYTNFQVLDRFSISKEPQATLPAVPTRLIATDMGAQILLSWLNTPTNEMGFLLERSSDGVDFSPLTTIAANQTSYTDSARPPGVTWFYRIRAWNDLGDSPYSAVTAVGPAAPPAIVGHPRSVTNTVGATIAFTVSATGAEPLSYQWFFNGDHPVSGGNESTLVLNDVQDGQAGSYHVVVTNLVGSATSATAWLVLQQEPVTLDIVQSGNTLSLSWPANAAGYELQHTETLAPGSNWQTITDGITTEGPVKEYQVVLSPESPRGFYRLQQP